MLKRVIRKLARRTGPLHSAKGADQPGADTMWIKRLACAAGQRPLQLRLWNAFYRAVAAQRASFAPLFTVENEAACRTVVAGLHQPAFRQVLNAFDFERCSLDRAGQCRLDHRVRDPDYVALRCLGQGLVPVQSSIRFESGFNGEDDARFIERNHASIAFADKELLSLKRV